MILSAASRRYKEVALHHVRAARGRRVYDPKIRYHLYLTFVGNWLTKAGETRRSDVSNRIKAVEDCISEGLGVDDSQFWEVYARKAEGQPPCVRVVLEVAE